MTTEPEIYSLNWQGHRITISYRPRSFAGTAHLQIRVRHARPSPIIDTGYRFHFISPADVAHLGGRWPMSKHGLMLWRRRKHGSAQRREAIK